MVKRMGILYEIAIVFIKSYTEIQNLNIAQIYHS